MKYYLSYVEKRSQGRGGHSALMLSCQDENEDKVKILSEVGLYIDSETFKNTRADKLRGILWKIRGVVKVEQNASLARYTHQRVQHRTYQISEKEAESYFILINRDRRSEARRDKKAQEHNQNFNGINYNFARFNCKTYALEIFKELGIVDAKTVRNPIIQLPSSTDKHMNVITQDNLRCDEKDEFLKNAHQTLSDISKLIKLLEDRDYFHDLSLKQSIMLSCTDFKKDIDLLNKELYKIGVSYLDETYLENVLKKMKDLNKRLPSEENRIDPQDQLLIDKFKKAYQEMDKLKGPAGEICRKQRKGELEYYWVRPPKSEKRLQVDTFTETEKAKYSVETKTNEMESCFSDLIKLIQKSKNGLTDNSQLNDLESLQNMIQDAINELAQCKEEFERPVKPVRFTHAYETTIGSNPILEKCSKVNTRLNLIFEDLQHKIDNFQPTVSDQSSYLLSSIKKIINYLRKDYKALAVDPKQVIKLKIEQQKKNFNLEEKNKNKPKKK